MGVKSYVSFLRAFYVRDFHAALEYRFNFVMQTIGMMTNDLFWVLFWFLFFSRFDDVRGWRFNEMLVLFAFLAGVWGFCSLFFGNWRSLAKMIYEGQLDYYLPLPKNPLLHALMKVRYAGMGDLLFGVLLALFVISPLQWPLFIVLVLSGSLIVLGWSILMSSITFYVGFFEGAFKTATEGLLSFSFYPFSIYSGFTKLFLLFVVPAGFITGIPVELMQSFSLQWFLITILFSTAFFSFSIWFFYRGLRKYESGNVMVLRG